MWAQIIQEDVPAAASALVVQPAARCLADCVDWLGKLDLSEVQIAASVGTPVDVLEVYGEQWFLGAKDRLTVIVTPGMVRSDEGADREAVETIAGALRGVSYVGVEASGQALRFQVPGWSVEIAGWLAALALAALSGSGLPAQQRVRLQIAPARV